MGCLITISDFRLIKSQKAYPRKNERVLLSLNIELVVSVIFSLGSSEYLYSFHNIKKSPVPFFDLESEYKIHHVLKYLIRKDLVESAHDVSDGGLYITLAESSMPNNLGFAIETDFDVRADAFLFGEAQGRIVVSVRPEKLDAFVDFLSEADVEFSNLGEVTEGPILIDEQSFGHIADAKLLYDNAIANLMSH